MVYLVPRGPAVPSVFYDIHPEIPRFINKVALPSLIIPLQVHLLLSFSITPGIMLGRMGPNGSALVNFCQSLNEAVLKIVAIVIW